MTMSELRFEEPRSGLYTQAVPLSAFGLGMIALGVVIVAVDPWNLTGVVSMLGGILLVLAGAAFTLLVWFLYVFGTIVNWRLWGQLRPPAVVIDDSGARFLAARRPALVPWADIEKVCVNRTVFPRRVVTGAHLRLAPGAALVRSRAGAFSPDRMLSIGSLSRATVPEGIALAFLAATAGPALQITETDRSRRAPNIGSARG